jgi:hypothetical protein
MRSLAARRWSELARRQSLALACLLLTGCNDPAAAPQAEATPMPAPTNLNRLAYASPTATAADSPTPVPVDVRLIILHVQTPRTARADVAGVWDLVREDVLDSGTVARLNSNGLRVGVGQIARWETVKDLFNANDKSRVYELPPLRNPPGVPLALNLDRSPHDQTIFFLDQDGIVSGEDWPASQKVLRVTYGLDLEQRDVVRLMVVPEIRQDLPPALSYSKEEGWATGRRRAGRAYAQAAFEVPLSSEQFVLIGPGENADVYGFVGGAFLTDLVNSERYDAYVFIRAEMNHGRPSK